MTTYYADSRTAPYFHTKVNKKKKFSNKLFYSKDYIECSQGLDVTNQNIFLLLTSVFFSDKLFSTKVLCIILSYLNLLAFYTSLHF